MILTHVVAAVVGFVCGWLAGFVCGRVARAGRTGRLRCWWRDFRTRVRCQRCGRWFRLTEWPNRYTLEAGRLIGTCPRCYPTDGASDARPGPAPARVVGAGPSGQRAEAGR